MSTGHTRGWFLRQRSFNPRKLKLFVLPLLHQCYCLNKWKQRWHNQVSGQVIPLWDLALNCQNHIIPGWLLSIRTMRSSNTLMESIWKWLSSQSVTGQHQSGTKPSVPAAPELLCSSASEQVRCQIILHNISVGVVTSSSSSACSMGMQRRQSSVILNGLQGKLCTAAVCSAHSSLAKTPAGPEPQSPAKGCAVWQLYWPFMEELHRARAAWPYLPSPLQFHLKVFPGYHKSEKHLSGPCFYGGQPTRALFLSNSSPCQCK